MNPNETSAPNSDTWARDVAEQLKRSFPHLANAVSSGLTNDESLNATIGDEDVATDFEGLCRMLEAYRKHVEKTASAENRDLLVQNEALKADIQEITEEIHVLVKSLERFSSQDRSSETHSGTARRISNDPEPFSGGEMDVAKRQQQFIAWRSQIKSCFSQDAAVFDTERRKILHIAGLLKGDAYESNRSYFDTITLNPLGVDSWHWKTAGEVFRSLRAQFETMDLAQQESQKWDCPYMIHRRLPDFIAEFRTVDQCCGEAEAPKIEALKKKASKGLADKEADQPLPPSKDDIDAWCDLCQRLWFE